MTDDFANSKSRVRELIMGGAAGYCCIIFKLLLKIVRIKIGYPKYTDL